MIALRYALAGLVLLVPLGVANAQITLDRDDFPFQLGTNLYANLGTENEDGTNTATLEALIAQGGPNQTYDFTPISFETVFDGTITVEPGATGPGAGTDPLDQATRTARFPFAFRDEDITVEGIIYFYLRLTDEAAFDLGAFFEGESDGMPFEITFTRTPGGERTAVFPYTFGDGWSSDFTETTNFDGFEIEADVSQTYEVDGWGTLVAPGFESGVPALRVKVTEERSVFGFPSTSVCYEFRSAAPVVGLVCEGDAVLGDPPTASVTATGAGSTAVEAPSAAAPPALLPAYPNPARDAMMIPYTVPQGGHAELAVFDVLGREVRRLASGPHAAGTHTEALEASGLAPGLYLARLTVAGQTWTRPLSVVR